jgi:protein SCO1
MSDTPDLQPIPRLGLAVAVLAAVAGVLTWTLGQTSPAAISGTVLAQPRALPEFALTQHDGTPFGRSDLEDHWSILFFGFTQCPDICPTTLFDLRRTLAALDSDGATRPMVILVTLDPMRDTPEEMATYITYFDPEFVGLTGELVDVQTLANEIGVAYAYIAGDGDSYSVDHTASLFLIDPQGRLAALFNPPHDAAVLAGDLQEIMR